MSLAPFEEPSSKRHLPVYEGERQPHRGRELQERWTEPR